jgi:hypothetical protein
LSCTPEWVCVVVTQEYKTKSWSMI